MKWLAGWALGGVLLTGSLQAGQRLPLALGETTLQPQLLQAAPPRYPPALCARRLPPGDLATWLAVDARGRVTGVAAADTAALDARQQAWLEAIREVLPKWRFSPKLVQHWAADAQGRPHQVDSAPVPFSKRWIFRFACPAE